MLSKISIEQVKERYPGLGETGVKLTKEYIILAIKAVEIKLIEEKELCEIESRYEEMESGVQKLQYLSTDILTLLKTWVNEIKVPQDSIEFEEWKMYSIEYPKVICYDAFVDLFISLNEALSKGWD
jgi:hypothetical protein